MTARNIRHLGPEASPLEGGSVSVCGEAALDASFTASDTYPKLASAESLTRADLSQLWHVDAQALGVP